MSKCYNLRSSEKKKKELKYYVERLPENNFCKDFNPIVHLERLKILETPGQSNFRFYVEEDRIVRKENRKSRSRTNFLLVIFSVLLLSLFLIYWQNKLEICGFIFYREVRHLQSNLRNHYVENIEPYKHSIGKYVASFVKKHAVQNKIEKYFHDNSIIDAFDKLELKGLVKTYITVSECGNGTPEVPFSCTDDHYRADSKPALIETSHMKKHKSHNSTYFECGNLTDYALASQGAKITSVFDTEPYGIFTLQHLNYDFGPFLSNILLETVNSFSKKGPTSILIPWQKPGDCWAFKGPRGRIQIQLSQKVMVTAVTIDHIPKNLSPSKNVLSAPKEFSVFGIVTSDDQAVKQYLGSYEYEIEGPSMQTFSVDLKTKTPVSEVEFAFESNQGNQMYTCVYKVRVHGYT